MDKLFLTDGGGDEFLFIPTGTLIIEEDCFYITGIGIDEHCIASGLLSGDGIPQKMEDIQKIQDWEFCQDSRLVWCYRSSRRDISKNSVGEEILKLEQKRKDLDQQIALLEEKAEKKNVLGYTLSRWKKGWQAHKYC